jgi:hypothetical protein
MGMLLSWALSKYSRERLDPVELRLVGAPSIASSSPSMLQRSPRHHRLGGDAPWAGLRCGSRPANQRDRPRWRPAGPGHLGRPHTRRPIHHRLHDHRITGRRPARHRRPEQVAGRWSTARNPSPSQPIAIADGSARQTPRSLNRCPGRLFTCGGQRERRAAHSLRADVCGVLLRLSPSQLRDGDGHQSEGFGA